MDFGEVSDSDAAALLAWVQALPEPDGLLAASDCEQAARQLGGLGFHVWQAGRSSAGLPLLVCSLVPEHARRVVCAYGYPHPDEPAGATGLLMLARGLAAGPPPGLEDVAWHLLLCADPDQGQINDRWVRRPSLDSYLRHNWRPLYQHLEVDYHFPVDHPPLYQPRAWAPEGLPVPLAESLALADLLTATKPDLLGLMHANHASGVYSYFTHRPHRSLTAAMDDSTRRLGLGAHLGERPDPGRRWQTRRPDLLKERRLADRLTRMHRMFGDLEGRRVVGCVSVAQFMESLRPDTMTLTPEVGLFSIAGIDDLTPSGQTREVTVRREMTRKGPRDVIRGQVTMPDGTQRLTLYHVAAVGRIGVAYGQRRMALTRGMAGVEAVELRRYYLQHADRIWATAKSHLTDDTPRRREREHVTVPAARVNDPSMLIFRTDPAYRRAATVAQVNDLQIRWGVQTCLWLGHGVGLYAEQDLRAAAGEQEHVLQDARGYLLDDRISLTPAGAQGRSQLIRLLLCAAALR